MKTCKTCAYRVIGEFNKHECTSLKIQEDGLQTKEEENDMMVYSYSEGGSFYVGDNFGCVHHMEKKEGEK